MRRERWRRTINDGRNIWDNTIVLRPRLEPEARVKVATVPYDVLVELLEHNGYVRHDEECER